MSFVLFVSQRLKYVVWGEGARLGLGFLQISVVSLVSASKKLAFLRPYCLHVARAHTYRYLSISLRYRNKSGTAV